MLVTDKVGYEREEGVHARTSVRSQKGRSVSVTKEAVPCQDYIGP